MKQKRQHLPCPNISSALRIARSYPQGPRTRAGLLQAGLKADFISIQVDNYQTYYKIDMEGLKRYFTLLQNNTLTSIAKLLKTSPSRINYIMLKNGIVQTTIMGRKFITDNNRKHIIQSFKLRRLRHGRK